MLSRKLSIQKNAFVKIIIFAHNEEKYIGQSIESVLSQLPIKDYNTDVYVLVNGTIDNTVSIAKQYPVYVHEYSEKGKARTWNRFVFGDENKNLADYYIFMDGDAYLKDNSIQALINSLENNPDSYVAAALPLNGRNMKYYQDIILEHHEIFGDCYALSKEFIQTLRYQDIKLPNDIIGDDCLIENIAKVDFKTLDYYQNNRVTICKEAGFYCHPVVMFQPSTWIMQYKRMINYSIRYFQNKIITEILKQHGANAIPKKISTVYPQFLNHFKPRKGIYHWFDNCALKKMYKQSLEKD